MRRLIGALIIAALAVACHDVKTETAASLSLERGQTWDWVPHEVVPWQSYKKNAEADRIAVREAYVDMREGRREERQERREEPVGAERAAERKEEIYDSENYVPLVDVDAAEQDRGLKREHKHIQNSIAGEMSSKGLSHVSGETPTYYVAYYLIAGGRTVAPRDYAPYEDRAQWSSEWRDYDEDTLVIDLVDPTTGKVLWMGSGVGRTRLEADYSGDEAARMRGVKKAVRDIMRDL